MVGPDALLVAPGQDPVRTRAPGLDPADHHSDSPAFRSRIHKRRLIQLRLPVAAYLARFAGSSRDHAITRSRDRAITDLRCSPVLVHRARAGAACRACRRPGDLAPEPDGRAGVTAQGANRVSKPPPRHPAGTRLCSGKCRRRLARNPRGSQEIPEVARRPGAARGSKETTQ